MTPVARCAGVGHAPASAAAASSVRFVNEIAECAVLFDDDVNAAVLRRSGAGLPTFDDALRARLAAPLLAVVTTGAKGRVALCNELGPTLGDEVSLWCEVLAELTGAARTGLRLACLYAAMCPRFHVDRVTVRLVCAYEGAGTELLAHEQVDRRWLGVALPPDAVGEPVSLMRSGASVVRAATGDVVLLKGEAWPGNKGRGCVHRSPAQTRADDSRVVLTLDPVE